MQMCTSKILTKPLEKKLNKCKIAYYVYHKKYFKLYS